MKQTIIILTLAATANAAPPHPPVDVNDRNLCAAVLIAEAGGEGRAGMQAVWEVVWSRAESRRWPSTPALVVKQRKQFSCLNGVKCGQLIAKAQRHPMWRHAWGITGAPPVTQMTKQANHYHAVSVRPYWADADAFTVQVGNHKFYRLP